MTKNTTKIAGGLLAAGLVVGGTLWLNNTSGDTDVAVVPATTTTTNTTDNTENNTTATVTVPTLNGATTDGTNSNTGNTTPTTVPAVTDENVVDTLDATE